MLALTAPILERLEGLDALDGWDRRTGTEHAERRTLPALDLRCTGAGVRVGSHSASTAVMVEPVWSVLLAVRRSDQAADQLDAAMAAVVGALHGWMPGKKGHRCWEPLQLSSATDPAFLDDGVAGLELSFTTAARYIGTTT